MQVNTKNTRWIRRILGAVFICLTTAHMSYAETVFHRGNGAEIGSLDMIQADTTASAEVMYDIWTSLTAYGPDASVIPGSAEKWDISPDGLVYTFYLRPDLKWSDGTPITAKQFVEGYRRAIDPKSAAKYAKLMFPIKNGEKINKGEITDLTQLGVEAVDDKTLKITLESPAAYFLGLTAKPSYAPLPTHAIEKHGKDWIKPGNLVSNGAFVPQSWVPQDKLVLVKNPNFYAANEVKLDKVIYYPTDDFSSALKRFRAGELDLQTMLPPDQMDWIRQNMKDELRVYPYASVNMYSFNTQKAPFNDARVRKALSMVLDREFLTTKIARGGQPAAYSYVPPMFKGYSSPDAEFKSWPMEKRVEEAKKLLKEAGFDEKNPLKFTLTYNTSALHQKIAVATQSIWKEKLGVDAQLKNSDSPTHFDAIGKGNFEVARTGWSTDYFDPHDFLSIFKSNAGDMNPSQYKNPEYDALLAKIESTANEEERLKLIQQAETMLLNDGVVAPLFYYVKSEVVKPYVKGYIPNNRDFHPSRFVSIEK